MNPFLLIQRSPLKRRRKTRRGPLRDRNYRQWISRHWSVLMPDARPGTLCTDYICQPCHTQNNGMSSKGPDSSCLPLTPTEHLEYDANRKAFELKYGVDMRALAAEYWGYYQKAA